MSAQEGSRKRQKVSKTESRPVNTPPAPSPAPATMAKGSHEAGPTCNTTTTCNHEENLKTLNTDIEAMRQLVTCKICDRLLYEPYAIACGHTYCYSCLKQWFANNPRKKTCPDCRVIVTQQPTPSYILRELVLVFASRNEMLPNGETTDEHHAMAKEEAAMVAGDKANKSLKDGGLFKGMFNRAIRLRDFGPTPGLMHDPGDGVDRCPLCNWEWEGGDECDHCGHSLDLGSGEGSDYESDMTDEELDHEIDVEDAAAFFGADGDGWNGGEWPFGHGYGTESDAEVFADPGSQESPQAQRDRNVLDLLSSDVERSDDEEDENGNLPDFVVADDEVAYADSSDADSDAEDTDVPQRQAANRSRRSGPAVASDTDGETATSAGAPVTEEEDSEDEGPVNRASQRSKRRPTIALRQRRARAISSDESESDRAKTPRHVFSNTNYNDRAPSETTDDHDDEAAGYGFSPLDDGTERSDDEYESASSIQPYNGAHEFEYEPRYGDDDDNEDDGEDETDASDDGWGTEMSRPRDHRAPPSMSSHGRSRGRTRRDRHTAVTPGGFRSARNVLDNEDLYYHPGFTPVREADAARRRQRASVIANAVTSRHSAQSYRASSSRNDAASRGGSFGHSPARTATAGAPQHPFNLDHTLARIDARREQQEADRHMSHNHQIRTRHNPDS